MVVHVVWNTNEQNISDQQIFSQIEVLNQDFNAENEEIGSVPIIFQGVIADVDFRFCLASRDPNGNATNGITRTQTNNAVGIGGTTAIHYSSQGGHDAWEPEKYLNIWVAKFSGNIGGVGSFPGEDPLPEQGVEINYNQFGTIGTASSPPYNLGRTCTHEIGHYFNLEHVWGPSPNSCCDEDDGVDDTPNSCETYINQCPTGNAFSCTQPDMYMNFMNYTDDACMAMFSNGQKTRMLSALTNFRSGLLESNGCDAAGLEDARSFKQLIAFQSASNGVNLEIKAPSQRTWTIHVYNAWGQLLVRQSMASNQPGTLEVDFPTGAYFVVGVSEAEILASKFIFTRTH